MNESPLLFEFISWIPIVMLLGVFMFYMRQSRSKSGMRQVDYLEELLKETRRHNEQLERLLASTNDRLADLERREAGGG